MKKYLIFAALALSIFSYDLLYSQDVSFKAEISGKDIKLINPTGVAVSSVGSLYVVDSENGLIQIFDLKGDFKASFGGKGALDGQFSFPFGIASSRDRIFVADSGNNRIQVFDEGGKFLYAFGRKGSADGELNQPKGITVDSQERVYIVDSGNKRVSIFTVEGLFLDSFGEKGDGWGQFSDPTGIAVSPEGHIWVADSGNNRVQVFDAGGKFKFEYRGAGNNTISAPTGIGLDVSGRAFVVDSGNGRIQTINAKGQYLGGFGSKGKGRAQFAQPQLLCVNSEGMIYVADAENSRVQVFMAGSDGKAEIKSPTLRGRINLFATIPVRGSDVSLDSAGNYYILDKKDSNVTILNADLSPRGTFGGRGKEKGQFMDPSSIVLDEKDHIYVSDTGNNRVQVFEKDGQYIFEFGGKGSSDGKFNSPSGLAYSGGKVWVADTGNYRIQVFSQDGIFLQAIGKKGILPGEFGQPVDIAVDGNLYIADFGNKCIQVLSKEGKVIRVIGKEGEGKGEFKGPRSLALDDDGRVFVLESETGFFGGGFSRIQVFDGSGKFVARFGAYGKSGMEMNAVDSISHYNRDRVYLLIADSGNGRVQVLEIKEVPTQVKDIKVESDESRSILSWQKPKESYIKGYAVYAAEDPKNDYGKVAEVKAEDNRIVIEQKDGQKNYYYAISAISKGGIEGEKTEVRDVFRQGYDLYRKGDWSGAAAFLKDNSSSQIARYYLGLSYISIGGKEMASKAKDIFLDLVKTKEFEEDAHFSLGRIALINTDFVSAEKEFNKVLDMNPLNKKVHYLMGTAYFKQGLYQKAVSSLQEAADFEKDNASTHEMLGISYRNLKAYEKSIAALKKGASIDQENMVFRKELGNTYLAAGEVGKAREEFRAYLAKAPDDVQMRVMLANAAIEMKDAQEAMDNADIIISRDKKNADAYVIKGKGYILLGKKEDALIALRSALEFNPKSEEGLFMLASLNRDLGYKNDAIEILKKLLDINKSNEKGRILLAGILAESGNVEEAVKEFRAVQKTNPKNLAICFPLGKLLYEGKDYDGARKELETALKNDSKNIEAVMLLGGALRMLGRTGEAINLYQEAAEADATQYRPHQELGRIFLEGNMPDKALGELKKAVTLAPQNAEAQRLMGLALLRKLRFDEAIEAFSTAVKLDPGEATKKELNDAFAAKKKFLETKQNVAIIEIRDANVNKVFASLYKYYSGNPIGEIQIANNSDDKYSNIKISLKVLNYMDFSTDQEIKEIHPRAVESKPLFASFNNKILEINEVTPAQAEVEVVYFIDKKEEKTKLSIPFTIYDRNSISWENPAMTGAFVTPKDDAVRDFARNVAQAYPNESSFINKQMSTAMLIYDTLGVYGMTYSADPNNPYEKVSLGEGAIDSLQYPRDTLKLKSGDCDDLSVLYATLLENIGMETALIGTPGHLHMMFRLDVDAKDTGALGIDPEQYVVLDDKVWIPVEMTLVGSSFSEAWYTGSEIYNKWKGEKKVEVFKVHESWTRYQPATLPPSTWSMEAPSKEKIQAAISQEMKLGKAKKISRLLKSYKDALEKDPKDVSARMQMGIIYGENGQVDDAIQAFKEIISLDPSNLGALNNLGNAYLMSGKLDDAIDSYRKSEEIMPGDAEVKVNLSIVYYKKGMIEEARKKFKSAVEIRPGIKEERGLLNSLLFK